jgi:hypothetical protein
MGVGVAVGLGVGFGAASHRFEEDLAVTVRAWLLERASDQVRLEPLKGTEKAAFG